MLTAHDFRRDVYVLYRRNVSYPAKNSFGCMDFFLLKTRSVVGKTNKLPKKKIE